MFLYASAVVVAVGGICVGSLGERDVFLSCIGGIATVTSPVY